jgi:hypothetical protein
MGSLSWRASASLIRSPGRGRIEVERAEDVIDRYAGSLPAGTYPRGYVDRLRDEWRAQRWTQTS